MGSEKYQRFRFIHIISQYTPENGLVHITTCGAANATQ
jgi:hypothetical protein